MTATGRPRKNRTYSASWWRYIASPSVRASYSDSQSSPRNPLWTKRTVVVPDRPSMVNSSACITPSGPGVPSSAKRCGGSQAVMVDSETSPPNDWRTLPPNLGSTSLGAPIHQPSSCCPMVRASQTSSGVASISTVSSIRNGCGISSLLLGRGGGVRGHARVDGQEDAVRPAARRGLVVIPADQRDHRGRQLVREGGPIRRRSRSGPRRRGRTWTTAAARARLRSAACRRPARVARRAPAATSRIGGRATAPGPARAPAARPGR